MSKSLNSYLPRGLGRYPKEELVEFQGVRLPQFLVDAISLKHDHEADTRPPLWIIWQDRMEGDGFRIDSICDSVGSAAYHVWSVFEGPANIECRVERIPANHRFASSIETELREHMIETLRTSWTKIHGYKRVGD